YEEINQRIKQYKEALAGTEAGNGVTVAQTVPDAGGPQALPQAVLDTVTSLAFAIDAKDHYTQGHSQKVSAYAALIAEAMEMSEAEIDEIRLGAVLHDIGKVADAYDTITSDRTYKKGRPAEEALAELERCANAQFDARIVEIFVRVMRQQANPIIEVASLTQSRTS